MNTFSYPEPDDIDGEEREGEEEEYVESEQVDEAEEEEKEMEKKPKKRAQKRTRDALEDKVSPTSATTTSEDGEPAKKRQALPSRPVSSIGAYHKELGDNNLPRTFPCSGGSMQKSLDSANRMLIGIPVSKLGDFVGLLNAMLVPSDGILDLVWDSEHRCLEMSKTDPSKTRLVRINVGKSAFNRFELRAPKFVTSVKKRQLVTFLESAIKGGQHDNVFLWLEDALPKAVERMYILCASYVLDDKNRPLVDQPMKVSKAFSIPLVDAEYESLDVPRPEKFKLAKIDPKHAKLSFEGFGGKASSDGNKTHPDDSRVVTLRLSKDDRRLYLVACSGDADSTEVLTDIPEEIGPLTDHAVSASLDLLQPVISQAVNCIKPDTQLEITMCDDENMPSAPIFIDYTHRLSGTVSAIVAARE